jgi:UDP-glucose:(heptosyl)LPS alpha-1,3-glucosyltransferase
VRFAVLRPLALGAAWRMWSFATAVERHVRTAGYDVVVGLGKTWTHDVVRLGGGCEETYLEQAHAATRGPWARYVARLSLKQRLAVRIERRALAPGAYARVITNSEMVKRDVMRRHGVPADRVTVIYNGVDLDRFHPRHRTADGAALRRQWGVAPDAFVVLFLGTGYGRKGLDQLLQAFPALLAQRPTARLVVAGYDSAQARYERQAAALGLATTVRFIGGRRDAEACFGAADLYALPTRYDPFANSTLEALATSVPVITTTANGASELLTHRTTGSVIAPETSDALATELCFWGTNTRARDAGAATRALAEQYSQTRTVEATAGLLNAVRGTIKRKT